jgi:pseudaminic acid synthase
MADHKDTIRIKDCVIGEGQPCFIIAEISGNHHQKYEEAEDLVRAAAEAGADAVKFQTYTPDTITLNSDKEWFVVGGKDQPDSWKQKVLYNLYKTAYTPWEWQPKLKELAESLGLMFFSTPFDDTAVDFLEGIGVGFYKIASYEAVHIPLLKKVAGTKKPVIISVGFASLEETRLAVETLQVNGSGDIVVLHCVTAYSDNPRFEYANLSTIKDLKERFGVLGGFSDNNSGIEIPIIAATVGGASVIEKHFILDRSAGGPDSRFSIEPAEFKEMVERIRKFEKTGDSGLNISEEKIKQALGKPQYGSASEQEAENAFFRPSLWVKADIKSGEIFSTNNMRVARPSVGLAPKFYYDILGKRAAKDIEAATPVSWSLVEK